MQQGIAQYVKRKEHHLIFTLAQPLTRAQTLWLDTQAGKLFDRYFVTDTYGEEFASLWEEVRDHWEAKNYE